MSDPQQLREKMARKILGASSDFPLDSTFSRHRHALSIADALLPLVSEELADRDERLAEMLRLNQEAEATLRKGIETRTAELAEAKRQTWDEACMALGWAIDNGPVESAATYVAKNNPYLGGSDDHA